MSYNKVKDPEEMIDCPYCHCKEKIQAKKMQYHLMKCRKNYTGIPFATCPFNARHEMPRVELRYHVARCPDRDMLEHELAYEQSKKFGSEGTMFKGYTGVPDYDRQVDIPNSENWDEEIAAVPRRLKGLRSIVGMQEPTKQSLQQSDKTFPYSLSMAGVGRGYSYKTQSEPAATSAGRYSLGRGVFTPGFIVQGSASSQDTCITEQTSG